MTARTMYVSDLDGTLLSAAGVISDRSAALLNDVIAQGALVTYATARSHASSRAATASLDITLPVVVYGGTMVADPESGVPRDIQFLDAEVIEQTLAASEVGSDTQPIFHTFEQGQDWLRWDPTGTTPGTARFVAHRAGDRRLRTITPDDPFDASSVFYVATLAPRPQLVDYRARLSSVLDHTAHFLSEDMHTPGLDWFEFHSPNGTKAAAIARLAETLGIERLVVFGDNHNDQPMFELADESYAVANAVSELKAIATAELAHHDSDSVAEWIAADWKRSTT